MSDNASESEQKQQMEKIFISADVWYGVFAFLCPFELGQIMALISDRLDGLVDVHFKSRKWPLGRLYIHRAIDGNGAQILVKSSGERQPIPEGPLPDNVIDFKRIQISYIDRTEDNANASYSQAVAKWLLTPRGDGLPKMLYCRYCLAQMDGLKMSFVNASEPVKFIMSFWFDDEDFVPFELTNNLTGEQLSLRQIDKYKWLLVRCPVGREEDKWAKWEKKAIGWKWRRQWNRIGITFKDGDIGDGMVEVNEGPSEPKKPKK
uniref:F-box domain-containing protein n=1 Tax=Globodera pallida TaxID=36090 RepID=A0A183C832_GLOPA